jgi:hypothetical protein
MSIKALRDKKLGLAYCLLIFIFAIGIIFLLPWKDVAAQEGENQSLTIYKNTKSGEQKNNLFTVPLNLERFSQEHADNFVTKAKLRLKTESSSAVASAIALSFPRNLDAGANGWSSRNGAFTWIGEKNKETTQALSLNIEGNQKLIDLTTYNALWIDYTSKSALPNCLTGVDLVVMTEPYSKSSKGNRAQTWQTVSASPQMERRSVSPESEQWKKKDYRYLLGRELRLRPDPHWRFVQQEKNVMIQRRLNWDLGQDPILRLEMSGAWPLKKMNVRVSFSGDNDREKIIELPENAIVSQTGENNSLIQIDLARVLRALFPENIKKYRLNPKENSIVLREIILFSEGDIQNIKKDKPLKTVKLFSTESKSDRESDTKLTLPHRHERLNAHSSRMIVDLADITRTLRATLESAHLRLLPPENSAECAINLNQVHLVGEYQHKIPVYVQLLKDENRKLHGPFLKSQLHSEKFEIVKTIKNFHIGIPYSHYHPCASLAPYVTLINRNSTNVVDTFDKKNYSSDYLILDKFGSPHEDNPARLYYESVTGLQATSRKAEICKLSGGLTIKRHAREIEFHIPVGKRVTSETRFFFGAENISVQNSISELILEDQRGSVTRKRVQPNAPSTIVDTPTSLKKLTLRIRPQDKNYKFYVNELILFEPLLVDKTEALHIKNLKFLRQQPSPILSKRSEKKHISVASGEIKGLLSESKPTRFTTHLTSRIIQFTGMTITYDFPSGTLESEKCFISLSLNGVNDSLKRTFCPSNVSGSAVITSSDLFSQEDPDIGPLVSVDWIINSRTQPKGPTALPTFTINFEINGWAERSVIDELQDSPLLKTQDGHLLRSNFAPLSDVVGNLASGHLWVPLTPSDLVSLVKNGGGLEPVDNPLFTVEEVTLKPRKEMDWIRWKELKPTLVVETKSSWDRRVIWLSLIVLLVLAALRDLWLPNKVWLNFRGQVISTYLLVSQGVRSAHCQFSRRLALINLYIGLAGFGLSLWLAAQNAGSYLGSMFLFLSVIFFIGVWLHSKGPSTQKLCFLKKIVSIFPLCNTALALGKWGLELQAFYGFLPLVGAAYLFLPEVCHRFRVFGRRCPGSLRLLGWTFIMLSLHGLTLVMGWGYSSAFGNMVAVLAMREGLLSFEHTLRARFPVVAKNIFDGAGSLYFTCAIICLSATAIILTLKLELFVAQSSVVIYYCILIGIFLELKALRSQKSERQSSLRLRDA